MAQMLFRGASGWGAVSADNPLPTTGGGDAADTATLSNVAGSASSVQLVAANAGRLGLILTNDSTADLMVKYGTTASASSFTVKIPAGGYWEMPKPTYTGRLDGIWTAAAGNARITELTDAAL